jgi:tetratricopeptide (TPR) repeat protein
MSAYGMLSWRESRPRLRAYAQLAAQLDPSLRDAQVFTRPRGSSQEENIAGLQAMLIKSPNATRIYDWLGHSLASIGYFSDALEIYQRGQEIDPLFPDFLVEKALVQDATGHQSDSEQTYLQWSAMVGLPSVKLMLAMRHLDSGSIARADELIQAYLASVNTSASAADIKRYLHEILDPSTRQAAIDDVNRQHLLALPGAVDQWKAILYVHLNDPDFWTVLQRIEEKDGSDGIVLTHLLANYRHHQLLASEEAKSVFIRRGYVAFWQRNKLPEFCDGTYQIWICALESAGRSDI